MHCWVERSKNGLSSGQLERNLLGAGAVPMKFRAEVGLGLECV